MPARTTRVNMPETIEELGKSCSWVDLDIEAIVYPGEPMVRYYPDGSGYPGSPPEVEIVAVTVTAYGSADWETGIGRVHRPDWFELLDRIVFDYVMEHEDRYRDEILEYKWWL